jgi:D-alanyl-D-alanine carboxypeptidase/D-alanyl-D-alanine-endopeptidase (penicillin-binding protein 4)
MKHFGILSFLFALALTLFAPLTSTIAQTASPPAETVKTSPLTETLDRLLSAPPLKNAIVGATVRSLTTGQILYSRNPQFSLMPASNQKIITAAVALAKLGADFRYKTTLYRTAPISPDGELNGVLYLRGSGDPTLTSENLRTLAEAVKAAGVTRFTGQILADPSVFDSQMLGDGWQWDDEPYYYQPQISGINCDANVLAYAVLPSSSVEAKPLVVVGEEKSPTSYVSVVSRVRTVLAGEPTNIAFDRLRATNAIVITGDIAVGSKPVTAVLTIENPARYTAYRFAEMLKAVGIVEELPSVGLGTVPAEAVPLATHESKPLSVMVADFLKPSDNLYGECFLKTLGAIHGKSGSWREGTRVVRDFLNASGIDTSGFTPADGSGLSRMNTVTPNLLADLLTYIDRHFPPPAKQAFYDGLPIGGVDGTLRNRFKGTPGAQNVRAKTGTLSGVSALSGYVTTESGERLVFSLIMNHYSSGATATQARNLQDAFVNALIPATEK